MSDRLASAALQTWSRAWGNMGSSLTPALSGLPHYLSRVLLHFIFSTDSRKKASQVVNPNDFCSHLKADALKCELSQLLSQ